MSDASPSNKLAPPRPLTDRELALIKKLIAGTAVEAAILCRLSGALMQDMADGGMGSIRFCNPLAETRRFGKQIAEGSFRDSDGVLVSVGLNLDELDEPFELDLWKVDFSPLLRYPAAKDFENRQAPRKSGIRVATIVARMAGWGG